jgi:iron(III) transport system permease protein
MKLPAWILWVVVPLVALTLAPLLVVGASWLDPQPEVWEHLRSYVLPAVLQSTAILAIAVALGVVVLGVGLAWLTAMCEFPGRSLFAPALVLPLAFPAYVLAFVHVGMMDYSGPIQTAWREVWGAGVTLPSVRSTSGAAIVFCMALYPYVYLLARQAFLTQGMQCLQAAQTLGLSRVQAFWRVALPMARPWIVAGLSLALMEMLADFGTVAIFNVDTFTTAIYKTWIGLFNLSVASQLASLLALTVLVLMGMEQAGRARKRYSAQRGNSQLRIPLHGLQAALATAACGLVLLTAFIVPLVQLLVWAVQVAKLDMDARYWGFVWHSLLLAGMTALLVLAAALALAYAQRQAQGKRWPGTWVAPLVRAANLGYAIPGMVLSVGLYVPVAWLDSRWLEWAARQGWQNVPTLKGTVLVLALALALRFMAVAFQPLSSAMQRITPHQEQAARTMGLGAWQSLWRLHLPMLRPGLLAATLLVFVEVLKEMPITLLTRPFGWDTLAVRIFEMTSEGMWDRAALPAVWVVAASLLPIVLLVRESEHT